MEEIAALVARATARDASRDERLAAFGELVRRFQDMAFGYAYSLLGDFHLAEDAAQEAFVAAFRKLDALREPAAFGGWLRRIVMTQCGRITRRKTVATAPLDAARDVPARQCGDGELADAVHEAIRSLPEDLRTVTTLFYINGYSHRDIADFLEIPATTVNSRLHDSRNRLKRRMLTMVAQSLRDNAPDERLSRKIIDQLLARPRLLEIPDHPVRQTADAIRAALADYEVIEGDEVVAKADYVGSSGAVETSYQVDDERILRPETTVATMNAMVGRTPPIRLLTMGRVFRTDAEDALHQKVFHQLDVLCAERGADAEAMKATLCKAVEAALGPAPIRWEDAHFGAEWFDDCAELAVKIGDRWCSVAGCATLTDRLLQRAGLDPERIEGFSFGVGLERLAMLKHGIDDIRKLWQPPYVPG